MELKNYRAYVAFLEFKKGYVLILIKSQLVQCDWCGNFFKPLNENRASRDHIFSDFLGGTLDLCAYDCANCKKEISKIEQLIAKHSLWGLQRAIKGRKPGNKKDPSSGAIIPNYFFAKNDAGWYVDSTLKSGETIPVILPSIQFSIKKGAYFSGDEQGKKKLKKLLEEWVSKSQHIGQLVAELDFKQVETQNVINDPDFIPRIFLNIKGAPGIIARTLEEAQNCVQTILWLTKEKKLTKLEGTPDNSLVRENTLHYFSSSINQVLRFKIISKILIGTIHAKAKKMGLDPFFFKNIQLAEIRKFLISKENYKEQPLLSFITELPQESSIEWPSHFCVFISSQDQVQCFIKIFDDCFKVDFATFNELDSLDLPFGIHCSFQGEVNKTRFLTKDEIQNIKNLLKKYLSQ